MINVSNPLRYAFEKDHERIIQRVCQTLYSQKIVIPIRTSTTVEFSLQFNSRYAIWEYFYKIIQINFLQFSKKYENTL